jgi:hypothetical protein
MRPELHMKKIIKWVVLGIVVLIVAVVLIVYMNINSIIKSTVQTQASDSLKVPTTLGSANLSLLGGSVSLNDLEIGSPQGFTSPNMFTLGGVGVKVNYGELRSQPMHIDTIRIDNPKLVLEQAGGKFNIKALMDQLPASPAGPPSGEGEKRKEGEPIKMIINSLTVSNTTVAIRPGVGMNVPGIKEEYTITVPTVEMKNIGSGDGNQNGAAIKDVAMLVMTKLADAAKNSDQLPPELKQLLNLNVDQLQAQMKEKLNVEVEKAKANVTNKLETELGKKMGTTQPTTNPNALIEQGVGGLLNRSKKAPTTRPVK